MELEPVSRSTLMVRRRQLLVWGGLAAAAGSVLAACGGAPASPTAEPAKPAATTAPGAAKPAAKVQGQFKVSQVDDYHPDHNAFVKKTIEEYSKSQGWNLELSAMAAFLAGADVYQKLLAMVQSGDPFDLMIHTGLSTRQMSTLDIGHPVDDIVKDMVAKYGKVMPGAEAGNFFDNKWWGVPFYGRTGGYWARKDIFEKAGINIDKDLDTWDKVRDACLKVSNPDAKMWGWGVTVNRSGDGESVVTAIMHHWGGTLTDETGQLVKLNSPETIAGMKWLAEVYQDKKWEKMLPPGVNSWTDPSNNEAYLAGQLAFTSNAGTMYAKGVFDKVPFAKDIKVLSVPAGPTGKRLQGAGAAPFYLLKGVKNREAAVMMINHLMDPEQQRFLWKTSTGYVVPPYKNLWQDPVVRGDENNVRFEAVAWAEPPFRGLAHPGPLSAAVDAVSTDRVMTDMMGQILKGKKVEDAVKESHDRSVKVFKDFGLKGA